MDALTEFSIDMGKISRDFLLAFLLFCEGDLFLFSNCMQFDKALDDARICTILNPDFVKVGNMCHGVCVCVYVYVCICM